MSSPTATTSDSNSNTNTSTSTSPSLVWVTIGTTQHAAFLLQVLDDEEKNNENSSAATHRCLVRWTSNNKTEWVARSQVQEQLSPRRRRPLSFFDEDDSTDASSSSSSSTSSSSCSVSSRKRRKSDPSSSPSGKEEEDQLHHRHPHSSVKLSSNHITTRDSKIAAKERNNDDESNNNKADDDDAEEEVQQNNISDTNGIGEDEDDEVEFLLTIKPNNKNYAHHHHHHHRVASSTTELQPSSDTDDDDDDGDQVEFISSLSLNEIMTRARGNNNNKNAGAAAAAVVQTTTMAVGDEETTNDGDDDEIQPFTAAAASLPERLWDTTPAATATSTMQSTSIDFHDNERHHNRKLPPRVSEVGMATQPPLLATVNMGSHDTVSTELTTASLPPSSSSSFAFPLVSSAYLQNLAEICSIICDDARWRVSEENMDQQEAALFRWEDGDDLSAVMALKQIYQPLPRKRRRPGNNTDCSCLLCRDQVVKPIGQQQQNQENEAATTTVMATDDHQEETPTTPTPDDKDIRWLYLYCRLFYRRGPWFRLDDLYERYYTPKTLMPASSSSSSSAKETPINETSDLLDATNDEEKSTTADTPSVSTARFKELKKSQEQNGKKRAAAAAAVDETILSMHMDRLDSLLHDLSRLQAAGLIRSFQGEEECGKTVGVSLLTQDLRTIVLSKLGGAIKKNKQGQQQNKGRPMQQSKKFENEIWNQMNRQKSIFASSTAGGGKSLLPVCKHVDEVILHQLVTGILKTSCAVPTNAHLPVAISRAWANQLKAKIRQTAKTVGVLSFLDNSDGLLTSMTCWRLRKKPTLTLQRCCRLFLCATSGPGQMRGDETNGWKSLKDLSDHNNISTPPPPPMVKRVKPPCLSTWYQVAYPGCSYRFGLTPAHFLDAYEPVHVNLKKNSAASDRTNVVSSSWSTTCVQIFASRAAFRAWEMGVELRANFDYLNELNDIIRGEERRQRRRESEASGADQESAVASISAGGSVDFMALLTESGRNEVLMTLLSSWNLSHGCCESLLKTLQEEIQKDIKQLDGSLKDEWEQILGIIGILAIHVLGARNDWISDHEYTRMESRPWLRHMWWDGNLAYILWDIIPMLERRELYALAVRGLEILLFGSCENKQRPSLTSRLAPLLLSRRARGKVCDRLVIDYTHMNRLENRTLEGASSRKEASDMAALEVLQFCERTIASAAHSAFIAFSSLRGLARRLKQPLAATLSSSFCTEANELGLRLENESSFPSAEEQEGEDKKKKSRYSDWEPITDRAIANSVAGVDNGAGSRCVFIGHEDGSLNVEELAMECYQSGRLPIMAESDMDESSNLHTGGGWRGWHDEGGHIRALFRILCAGPILGMDWGCYDASSAIADAQTIHLSPYQGAPFDLHVGFELRNPSPSILEHQQAQASATPGFYYRRQEKIDSFLDKLTNLSPQEICDLVHDSVVVRLRFMAQTARKDPSLERDVDQLRTMSLIAAGCGGKQLAAIFRCFCFDYRHYSGGLPDLLLVRARFRAEGVPPLASPLVDLSGWIGESFSHEHQAEMQAQRGAAMLADDEFLACSKVGDSGGGGGRRNRSSAGGMIRQTGDSTGQKKSLSLDDMPPRLELVYQGQPVIPECLMVEVKSSNDRLDARQEDWLNILDSSGKNCRVCKFEASNKNRQAGNKKAALKTAPAAK